MNGFILRSGGHEVNRFTIDSKKRPPHLRNNDFCIKFANLSYLPRFAD